MTGARLESVFNDVIAAIMHLFQRNSADGAPLSPVEVENDRQVDPNISTCFIVAFNVASEYPSV